MTAPVVVFAVGNPSRGDDAIGPALRGRLAEWLENEGLADRVDLIEDFQLNIEHAIDLQGRELALFIDAGENTPAPFVFGQIYPSTVTAHSTHALPPETVLQVYQQIDGAAPPPAFVLCVRGDSFDLGDALTPAAALRIDEAMCLLRQLCRNPDLLGWMEFVTNEGCSVL